MPVLGQRVVGDRAVLAPNGDGRDLALEGDELLDDERHAAEPVPRSVRVRLGADDELAAPVVAQAPGLDHGGQSDGLQSRLQPDLVVGRGEARRGQAKALEEALLGQAVLRRLQGARTREDRRPGRRGANGRDGHVLELERDHVARAGHTLEGVVVVERRADERGDLPGARVRRRVEERKLSPNA